MSSQIIDLTTEIPFPEDIKKHWLPLDGQSVPHLFIFNQYPPQPMLYHHPHNLSQLLHEEGVTNFQPHALLNLGPPPLELSDSYQAAIKRASHPVCSFTLNPLSGHPVTLPLWVLDYWREIGRAMGYRRNWKEVLIWLRGFSG
jgi:hypothetical protein